MAHRLNVNYALETCPRMIAHFHTFLAPCALYPRLVQAFAALPHHILI